MKKYLTVITCFAIAALIFVGGCQEQAKTEPQPTVKEQAKTEVPPAVKEQAKTVEPVVEQPVAQQAKTVEPVVKQPVAAETAKVEAPKEAAPAEKTQAPVAEKVTPKIETPALDPKFVGVEVILNGTPIITEQVKEAIKDQLLQIDQQLPPNVRDVYKNREIQKAVQVMIEDKLVGEEVKKAGIVITNEDVNNFINEGLVDANMTMEQLREKIKADGMTYEQWMEKMEFQKLLAFNKLTDKEFEPQLKVDPNDVNDFYTQNPQYFNLPEQVQASHILVKTEKDADPNLAKAKAEGILKQIKEGADFAEMAKKESADTASAIRGGDVGYFSKEMMVKPFADAAFSMKVGQVSDLVKSDYGYHIIKVTGHKNPEKVTLAKAEKSIVNYLKMQKRQVLEKGYKENLKKAASIVYPPGKDPKDQMTRRPPMMSNKARPAPSPAAAQPVTPSTQPKEAQPAK